MEGEKNENTNEEVEEKEKVEETENKDDKREEETEDEIRDEDYANDDIIEMLDALEKKFDGLNDKFDNMISMSVDSGAIIQDSVNNIVEDSAEEYAEDFIDLDELDLKL